MQKLSHSNLFKTLTPPDFPTEPNMKKISTQYRYMGRSRIYLMQLVPHQIKQSLLFAFGIISKILFS